VLYKIHSVEIDFSKYRDWLDNGFVLKMCKEIMNLSGCSLKEARELYDKVVAEQHIPRCQKHVDLAKMLMAEYEEDGL